MDARKLQKDWAACLAKPDCLADKTCRARAEKVGREIMRQARANVEALVGRLRELKYRFILPDRAHIPSSADLAGQIAEFESHGLSVPLALRLWYEEVGEVNLMGDHPQWEHPGYAFGNHNWSSRDWYTDPLVVENPLAWAHDAWRERVEWEGADKVGSCSLVIAPDRRQKANVSGSAPYEMAAAQPVLDTIVRNEAHQIHFIDYLRLSFAWGGFPGFESIPNPPREFLAELKKVVTPI